jgi:Holliday junction resolvasome RuvABC endonuclease subunit
MIGIDPGLNIGSVTCIKEGYITHRVLNFAVFKSTPMIERLCSIANQFYQTAVTLNNWDTQPKPSVSIEEPFYAYGKTHPRHMAGTYMLFGMLVYTFKAKFKIIIVHNMTVKKLAGYKKVGLDKKLQMVKAYRARLGRRPPHRTKYGQETLADSYFIALAGQQKLKEEGA